MILAKNDEVSFYSGEYLQLGNTISNLGRRVPVKGVGFPRLRL